MNTKQKITEIHTQNSGNGNNQTLRMEIKLGEKTEQSIKNKSANKSANHSSAIDRSVTKGR